MREVSAGGDESEPESVVGVFGGEDDGGGGLVVVGVGVVGYLVVWEVAWGGWVRWRGGVVGEAGGEVDGEEGLAYAGVSEEEGEVCGGDGGEE